MSERIPKSARDVLARQTAADAHPAPDLLNAYVEHALSDAEKQPVMLHLASCADCREVVFLASAAAEELEPVLVAASPNDLPATASTVELQYDRAVLQSPPKPPKLWWKWAVPLTAVVVVGAVVLVERDRLADRSGAQTTETASVRQAPAPPVTNPAPANPTVSRSLPQASETSPGAKDLSVAPPASSSKAKSQDTDRLQSAQAQLVKPEKSGNVPSMYDGQASKAEGARANAVLLGPAAGNPESPAAAPVKRAKAAKPTPAPSSSQAAEVTSAAPLVQAGNDVNSVSNELKTQAMAKSLTAGQAGVLTTLEMDQRPEPAKTRWRISRDGHVEHMVGPSTWERVMSAEPVTFRVVATVGNNVWAGGSDGALFHSSDGGHHWERVGLADEHGTITSIHFNNAQQGTVESDSGAKWVTSDGGTTWSKQ